MPTKPQTLRSRRWAPVAVKLSLLAGSSALALALAEILLRMFAPTPHSMVVQYQADGHLGARLRPNQTYTNMAGGTCSVNNLGYRGASPLSYVKPEGALRIVVLGGSSTFCFDTADDSIWTALLERKLRSSFGPRVEVINAGIPGYSVFDSKIHYLYRIRGMSPDVVIVYHTWNDMKRFRAEEAGVPILKGMRRPHPIEDFLKRFELAWRVRTLYEQTVRPRLRENWYSESLETRLSEIRAGGAAHQWERRNYEDLALLLEADRVLPVFASQGGLLYRENFQEPAIRAAVQAEFQGLSFLQIVEQWEAVAEIIEEVSELHDLVYLNAYEAIPHSFEAFADHVHLTDHGNALLADFFYRRLMQEPRFLRRLAAGTPARTPSPDQPSIPAGRH